MKLIIADDHDLVRDAIATLIERDDPSATVLHASDYPGAAGIANAENDVELMLLDVHMPGMNNMLAVREATRRFPNLPVVLMSGLIRQGDVARGFEMGARGFIPKTMNGAGLVSALKLVLSGTRYVPEIMLNPEASVQQQEPAYDLTSRERDVLAQLVKGLSNKVIARILEIEESTVKLHLRSLFKKLDVRNRTEAVIVAIESGMFSEQQLF